MKRREALKLTAILIGGSVIGSDFFLSGCAKEFADKKLFSESDVLFLDEVGETILPETDLSPVAKTAKIGMFMKTIVSDCYSEKEQEVFIAGIALLNGMAQDLYSGSFLRLTDKQKFDLIAYYDKESRNSKEGDPFYFFSMMKQLTLWGYFSSEPGVTKALRYNPIPREFKGCVPYLKGEKAWA